MCARDHINKESGLLHQSNGLMRNNKGNEILFSCWGSSEQHGIGSLSPEPAKNINHSPVQLKFQMIRLTLLMLFLLIAGSAMAQTSTSPTQTVCPGIEPYLVVPDNINNIFLWTITPGVSGTDWTIIPGADGYHISVNWANPGAPVTYTLTLTETTPAPNSCSTIRSVAVTINPLLCRYCCFQQPCLRRFSAQSDRRACRYDYICLDRT